MLVAPGGVSVTPSPSLGGTLAKPQDQVQSVTNELHQIINGGGPTHVVPGLNLTVPQGLGAITGQLNALPPKDVQAVFSQFQAGDYQKFAASLDTLSAGDRQELLNTLAKSLNGKQLAGLEQALGKSGTDQSNNATFIQSVTNFASPDTKADFVSALVEPIGKEAQSNFPNGLPGNATGSPTTRAAAVVLGSLKGNQGCFDRALTAFASDTDGTRALNAVMNASINRDNIPAGNAESNPSLPGEKDDTSLTQTIVNSAAHSGNPQLKVTMFESASTALNDVADENTIQSGADQDKNAKIGIASSMQTLLNSDPQKIITGLSGEHVDPAGNALKSFSKIQMLTSNGQKALSNLAQTMMTGPGKNQNFYQYMGQVGPGGVYQNAKNFGYYSGAVYAAMKSVGDDKLQAMNGMNSVLSIIGDGTGAIGSSLSDLAQSLENGDPEQQAMANWLDMSFPTQSSFQAQKGDSSDPGKTNAAQSAIENAWSFVAGTGVH